MPTQHAMREIHSCAEILSRKHPPIATSRVHRAHHKIAHPACRVSLILPVLQSLLHHVAALIPALPLAHRMVGLIPALPLAYWMAALIQVRHPTMQYIPVFYGTSFLEASSQCTHPCPTRLDSECPSGEQCYGNTSCPTRETYYCSANLDASTIPPFSISRSPRFSR